MHSELKIGDIVETIKGAKFWGEIIAFDNDVSLPGCMVRAVDPGFEGTKHVYPLTQIARRSPPQEPSSASMGVVVKALRNLVHEMRFLLRANPDKDGGLYRQRLDEAEAALKETCQHGCDEGGICLAELSGYPESCLTAAPSPSPAPGVVEALTAAKDFIALEYADARQEQYGEWLAPEARKVFGLICEALASHVSRPPDARPIDETIVEALEMARRELWEMGATESEHNALWHVRRALASLSQPAKEREGEQP